MSEPKSGIMVRVATTLNRVKEEGTAMSVTMTGTLES